MKIRTQEELMAKYPKAPPLIVEGIWNYAKRARGYGDLGGFLYALLCNDLFGAVNRADNNSFAGLEDIMAIVWNEIPSNIWGSKEHVNSWLESDTPVESVDDSPVGELRWDGGDQ